MLCECEDGHEGRHQAEGHEWDDATAEERELLRRAEQETGERHED